MATGWQGLGDFLAGGTDPNAYDTGRLRTAQTESALLTARNTQLKNIAAEAEAKSREGFRDAAAKAGIPPEQLDLADAVVTGGMGSDFSAYTTGAGNMQKQHYTDILGNPNAPLGDAFAAGQAVQGKVLNPYDQVTANTYVDVRAPGAPGAPAPVQTSPVGQAAIGADEALTNLRNVQSGDPDYKVAGSGDAGGLGKEPPKYKLNPHYDPTKPPGPDNQEVVPVTGGPADPNAPIKLGTQALAQFGRVMGAAGNTVLDLKTIVDMPSGATTGVWGESPKGLLSAWQGVLANKVTPEEVQQYRAIMDTFSEQLSTMERMGLRGTQGSTARFDSLALKDGDSVATKMLKLAQVRQTIENTMDTLISLNALPPTMAARAKQIRDSASGSIPFTPQDIVSLQASKNKRETLADIVAKREFNAPVRPGQGPGGKPAPAAAPAAAGAPASDTPLKNDKGWDLMEDANGHHAYVSPSGEIEEVD